MFKNLIIASVAATALVAASSPTFAGLGANGLASNALANNAITNNALTPNAVIAHTPPSDFCAQGKGDAVIAHAPPSDFCAQGGIAQPAGLSFGGLDGMKVMGIELPR